MMIGERCKPWPSSLLLISLCLKAYPPFIHIRHPFQVQPRLAEGLPLCDPSVVPPLSAVASLWTAPIVTFSMVFFSDDTPPLQPPLSGDGRLYSLTKYCVFVGSRGCSQRAKAAPTLFQ
ncbi:hypothetical protein BDP55DRAFT_337682 [Colletotrichum godetiae]|uniref:Uncharacterized protein n=1 Tax=Colletotrichum godetiae TaxID=1209918 RepID=A0AAJ0EQG4_9PEZI|nr:uncharacterized protein BDP55DRAFT_337682 [Colletotrichum godetiae]KAK1659537.1 hypothetical protein BDP55DRAFT_337682 [Colletotrichum godetiae]